jgi:hypothetical protein
MIRDVVLGILRERLAQPQAPQQQAVEQLRTRLQKLRHLEEMGDDDGAEYLKRRGLDRQLAAAAPTPTRVLDAEHAMNLLSDLPARLATDEPAKLRALVRQIVDAVGIEKDDAGAITVKAIKPASSFALVLPTAADLSFVVTSTGAEAAHVTSGLVLPPVWDAFGIPAACE